MSKLFGLAISAALLAASPALAITNLVSNSSFEAGLANWTIGGSDGQTGGAAFEHTDRGPRRDGKRDGDGEQHRRRGTDGNRPHVRAHQPTDERHGENRRNHRQSGEDRRVADFVDGFERDLVDRFLVGTRQPDVAHDIFDDDNCVIHQDPDREDQREERDAVQRVAQRVVHEQRERQRVQRRAERADQEVRGAGPGWAAGHQRGVSRRGRDAPCARPSPPPLSQVKPLQIDVNDLELADDASNSDSGL